VLTAPAGGAADEKGILMVEQGATFRPGEFVPSSGIYQCESGCGHRHESTDVKGHRFPPLPADCKGGRWVLEHATQHR
jgi:hypothetical protein